MHHSRKARSHGIPIKVYPFGPSTYPGKRPHFSFFFTPRGIYRLKVRSADRFLAERGLPLLTQRFAVLAYGSNACPDQLLRKYRRCGLTNVPVLFGRLVGAEAVYAHRQTKKDRYVPASLARRSGRRSSWITMLTEEQLQQMDASEGRGNSYELAELSKVQFVLGKRPVTPLYAYINVLNDVMLHKGRPVSLRSARQKRARSLLKKTTEGSAEEWLDYAIIRSPSPPAQYSRIL